MTRWIQRKLRALFLYHFRDDLRLAYDRGYIVGLEDAGGPAFEDGWDEGFAAGHLVARIAKPCADSPS